MRRFFISFLGAMAALWVTAIIATLGLVALFVAVGASHMGDEKSDMEIRSHSVLHLDLSGPVVEHGGPRPSVLDLMQGSMNAPMALDKIVAAIDAAASDSNIDGIFIEANGGSTGLAQANAIIAALKRFKESGKWIYAYGDSYSEGEYYIASAADSLFVNPIGMIDIHGLGYQGLYFKDLLDKVGISVDVVRVGTYKSAVEPYLRNDMSEAAREQVTVYLSSMWDTMSAAIAGNRNVKQAAINSWADSISMLQTDGYYLREKIADRSLYRHEMDRKLADLTDRDSDEDPRLVGINEYYSSKSVTPFSISGSNKKHIAILYAEGEITQSGDDGISSDRLIPVIEKITSDDNVAGLILRVNSPGGDAFASEQIWEALEQYKKITGKPFYVSMSDVAASGGYYISCGADRIYAEPLTITGSIGIFGMIPNVSQLLNEKLGVHTSEVYTNPSGALPSLLTPMSPNMRSKMQAYVNRGYELFTKRCADGRHMSQDSIKVIAEGRVWDGKTALGIGLVDRLGGLDMAVTDMAADIDIDKSSVVAYPKAKYDWIYDLMNVSRSIEDRATAMSLGMAYPYYKQIKRLGEASVLQARMENPMPQ